MNVALMEIAACLLALVIGCLWGRVCGRQEASRKIAGWSCFIAIVAIIFAAGFQTRTPFYFGLPLLLGAVAWLGGWYWEAFM